MVGQEQRHEVVVVFVHGDGQRGRALRNRVVDQRLVEREALARLRDVIAAHGRREPRPQNVAELVRIACRARGPCPAVLVCVSKRAGQVSGTTTTKLGAVQRSHVDTWATAAAGRRTLLRRLPNQLVDVLLLGTAELLVPLKVGDPLDGIAGFAEEARRLYGKKQQPRRRINWVAHGIVAGRGW